MRNVKRVPIIIEALKNRENKKKLLLYLFKPREKEQMTIDHPFYHIEKIIEIWEKEYNKFSKMYNNYNDLRVTQVLVNCNIINNYPGTWYYIEDEKLMIESEILSFDEVCFWGQNYDKKGNLLEKTKFIPLKDLDIDHIKNILKHNSEYGNYLTEIYVEYFEQRIKDEKKK